MCHLSGYTELKQDYRAHSPDVSIQIFSEAKPQAKTHRNDKPISLVREHDVLLNTGPRWELYNAFDCNRLRPLVSSGHVPSQCTFKLQGSSGALQKFLTRTSTEPDGVASNRVISDQHTCQSGD
jgi:hypothetical protein